jgi:hypothetical protein
VQPLSYHEHHTSKDFAGAAAVDLGNALNQLRHLRVLDLSHSIAADEQAAALLPRLKSLTCLRKLLLRHALSHGALFVVTLSNVMHCLSFMHASRWSKFDEHGTQTLADTLSYLVSLQHVCFMETCMSAHSASAVEEALRAHAGMTRLVFWNRTADNFTSDQLEAD